MKCFTSCDLWTECMGSDHCPVWAELDVLSPELPQGFLLPALSTSHTFAGVILQHVGFVATAISCGLCWPQTQHTPGRTGCKSLPFSTALHLMRLCHLSLSCTCLYCRQEWLVQLSSLGQPCSKIGPVCFCPAFSALPCPPCPALLCLSCLPLRVSASPAVHTSLTMIMLRQHCMMLHCRQSQHHLKLADPHHDSSYNRQRA